MYEGNLEVEELLDWVRSMEKYFDYEDIEEYKMVKHLLYKSSSSLYISLRCLNPKVSTWNSSTIKLLLLKAYVTLLAVPAMCLITKVKFCMNSTHFACF
jgi:hypothetical protein